MLVYSLAMALAGCDTRQYEGGVSVKILEMDVCVNTVVRRQDSWRIRETSQNMSAGLLTLSGAFHIINYGPIASRRSKPPE